MGKMNRKTPTKMVKQKSARKVVQPPKNGLSAKPPTTVRNSKKNPSTYKSSQGVPEEVGNQKLGNYSIIFFLFVFY